MKKNQSEEDYLEAILVVREKKGNVRSIDVVNELNVSKPSVSVAMKKLRSKGLVTFDDNGYINFTSDGKSIAENIYNKANEFLIYEACSCTLIILKTMFNAVKG